MKQFVVSPTKDYIDKNADGYVLLNDNLIRNENRALFGDKYSVLEHAKISDNLYHEKKKYISDLSVKFVEWYMESIDKVFKVKFSFEQANLFFGIFIRSYLFDVLSRYEILRKIKNDNVYLLDGIATETYVNQREYGFSQAYDAEFQMKIFASLATELGIKVQTIDDSGLTQREQNSKSRKKWKERCELLRNNPGYVITKLKDLVTDQKLGYAEILVVESRMPKEMEAAISQRCKRTIVFSDGWYFWKKMNPLIQKYAMNFELRDEMFASDWDGDEFEIVAYKLLKRFIPLTFCEAYYDIFLAAQELTKEWNYKKIYHSAHITELFSMCCALMKSRGAETIDIQHGALYGGSEYMMLNECEVWDKFITWGWTSNVQKWAMIKPVAMSRLPVYGTLSNSIVKEKILLVTGIPELNDFGSGWDFNCYFDEQKAFISNLTSNERRVLHIRLRSVDEDKAGTLVQWCRQNYPEITFEYVEEKSFTTSLLESKLLVCDYYSSSHLEALMLGVPFTMFEAAKIVSFHPNAKHYITLFESFGVYKKSGKALALEIVKHKDYRQWLFDPDLQQAYSEYLSAMTRCDEDIIGLWCEEFDG